MGGSGRADAGVVSIGDNIYIIGGINFPNFSGFNSCRKYDVVTDTWVNGPSFNGGVIIAPVMQNVNGRVFAGTGYYGSIAPRNDWWEFTSLPASIKSIELDQPLAFPNPFSNKLTLNLKNDIGELRIEIADALGNFFYSEQQKNTGLKTKIIDTKNFSRGIYFLRITNGSGGVSVLKKIIKS
jgi:hypothetical protein